MEVEDAITALLLSDARLSALVDDRIHWLALPQAANGPSIVLQIVSGRPDYHAQGASGLEMMRLQIDARAQLFNDAKASSGAAKAVLSGQRISRGGWRFQGGFVAGLRDTVEETAGNVARIFRRSTDIMLWTSKL